MAEGRAIVDAVTPREAWALLGGDADAALVDVRTQAEWSFVGVPCLPEGARPLLRVEWARFPGMTPNEDFCEELASSLGTPPPRRLLFLCRSGQRSRAAAGAMAAFLDAAGHPAHCTNVEEGFEGDRDADGRRGGVSGWKARGLPWTQG